MLVRAWKSRVLRTEQLNNAGSVQESSQNAAKPQFQNAKRNSNAAGVQNVGGVLGLLQNAANTQTQSADFETQVSKRKCLMQTKCRPRDPKKICFVFQGPIFPWLLITCRRNVMLETLSDRHCLLRQKFSVYRAPMLSMASDLLTSQSAALPSLRSRHHWPLIASSSTYFPHCI